jgi:amino-acid N-acetyltransferase
MSGATFAIRAATPADTTAIEALLRAADLPLAGVSSARFAVAEHAGAVIGTAGLEVRGDAGLLRSVAVADEWRGHGVGEALVRAVLDEASRCKLDPVVLLTTTAPAWFPRFGFEVTQRADVPATLLQSAEFTGACPDSAVVMSCHPPAGAHAQSNANLHTRA